MPRGILSLPEKPAVPIHSEAVSYTHLRALQLPQILLGAEVYLSVDTLGLADIERLCIGDTRTILLEMPFTQWGSWVYDGVYRLLAGKGLKPVIAHLERYSFLDVYKRQ